MYISANTSSDSRGIERIILRFNNQKTIEIYYFESWIYGSTN